MTTRITKGGPRTATGKNISSKNALIHGATSNQLLNQEEKGREDHFIKVLSQQYSPKNQLIQIQIERAGRVHVQLNRVQDLIDELFNEARKKAHDDETLKERFKMNDHQWLLARISSNPLTKKVFANDLLDELPQSDELSKLIQHIPNLNASNFLEIAPKLAQYLYQSAQQQKVPLTYYLHDLMSSNFDKERTNSTIQKMIEESNQQKLVAIRDDIEKDFLELSTKIFERFTNWYGGYYEYYLDTQYKIQQYSESLDQIRKCSMPDPDKLDRLMRYQTTLQKQLSTIMGQIHLLAQFNPS